MWCYNLIDVFFFLDDMENLDHLFVYYMETMSISNTLLCLQGHLEIISYMFKLVWSTKLRYLDDQSCEVL